MRLPLPARACAPAACVLLIASGELAAQQSRPAAAPADLPITIFTGRRSESDRWPKADISVERDAYVTVLAITPGVNRFAVQVLSPASPKDDGFIRPRHPQRLGYFSPDAVGHRVARGSSVQPPIIIGITSKQKPDLSAFARGKAWATDLVINVPIDTSTDLADVVAQAIFRGDSVQFGVAQMPTNLPGLAPLGSPVVASGALNPPGQTPTRNCSGNNRLRTGQFDCSMYDDRPGAYRWLALPPSKPPVVPVPPPVKPPTP